MRLALFDLDEQLVQLARSAAQAKEHTVAILCQPGEHGAEVLRLFPAARLEANWEALLVAGEFDGLVVGRSGRDIVEREELLRRAVQEAVPLVAVQPAADSIVMHELAMIQRDTRSLLVAWNESCEHPAARRLLDGVHGRPISQIVLQRSMADATPRAVFAQLARDADLLQALAGTLDRVTALGPAGGERLTTLAVTFAGASEALVQWVLQPQGESASGKVTIAAAGSIYTLQLGPPGDPWELVEEPSSEDGASSSATLSIGDAMLRAIDGALAADPTSPTITQGWKDACHAAELAEGAQQSLRRGRTIQLQFEEHSEEQTFKGVMAIGGCLVLILTLVVLAVSAVIDALGLPLRNSLWWRLWPLYVLAPAVLLLAAQSLWRVFAARPDTEAVPRINNHSHD